MHPNTIVIDRIIRVAANMIPLVDDIDAKPPFRQFPAQNGPREATADDQDPFQTPSPLG
jgi:hypothetical protein